MVNEEWKQEFVKTGYALVSANVQQGTYPPDKSYGAIRWLARSDPARRPIKKLHTEKCSQSRGECASL